MLYGYDEFFGGEGADKFSLQASSTNKGNFFEPGQKYAVIRDFDPTNENDKIILPGNFNDYIGLSYEGDSTAILYKEDPTIQVGITVLGTVGLTPQLAIQVPDQTALVAILDGTEAKSMENGNFYQYLPPSA